MLRVTLDIPGCKSASQRALILAALAKGESTLSGLSTGEDSQFLIAALRALGWELTVDDATHLRVIGRNGPQTSLADVLALGEGGSTLRFLVPMLAAAPQNLQLKVADGLRARPQQPLVDALSQMGACLTPTADGFHLVSKADAMPSDMEIPMDLSSQFFSGFLMASGRRAQTWRLPNPPVSRGYLEMTVSMLQQFRGTDVLQQEAKLWHQSAGFGVGQNFVVPADASAVVFFAVAAVLLQRTLSISREWDPRHPDMAVLRFLEKLHLLRVEGRDLMPIAEGLMDAEASMVPVFDLQDSPDSGPALAVLASRLPRGMRFVNSERLRFKESNRLDGMQRLAAILGGEMSQRGEELCIQPGIAPSPQAVFDSNNDHRLAMAAGIASLLYPSLEIGERSCVAKSFPDFWNQLARLS